MNRSDQPNILFVFGDQWRAQATGYAGDPNVRTPTLDRLAAQSLNFTHAVANCPVCCPWRASLMTGQYPLTHGVFVNDVPVHGEPAYLAECFSALIELPACFHQFAYHNGGRDWRGLRTRRYTYVIDHDGPWMLYDNERDPYQMRNIVNAPEHARIQAELDTRLRERLALRGDGFAPGQELIRAAGYPVNERGDPIYQP